MSTRPKLSLTMTFQPKNRRLLENVKIWFWKKTSGQGLSLVLINYYKDSAYIENLMKQRQFWLKRVPVMENWKCSQWFCRKDGKGRKNAFMHSEIQTWHKKLVQSQWYRSRWMWESNHCKQKIAMQRWVVHNTWKRMSKAERQHPLWPFLDPYLKTLGNYESTCKLWWGDTITIVMGFPNKKV